MKNRKLAIVAVIVLALAYFAGLLIYSRSRPIDGDEGFYTTAARLVAEGKTPYQDFFYPQAPLLPYIYAAVWSAGGRSLESMRALSVACGAAAVLVWGLFLVSAMRLSAKTAFATLAVLLLNPYWISWNVVVKTYALSNFLVSLALASLYLALSRERARWFFAAGLAMGLTTSVRSLYGPLVPLVLAWMLIRLWRSGKGRYSQIVVLAAGALIGLIPIAYSFLRDPQLFLFNNVGYHVLWREAPGMFARLWWGVFFALVSLFLNPYLLLQFVLFAAGALSLQTRAQGNFPRKERSNLGYYQLVSLMLLVLALTSLTLYPVYVQYFTSPLIPFLVPLSACGIPMVFAAEKRWAVLLAVTTCLFSAAEIPRAVQRHSAAPEWRLTSYHDVVKTIQAITVPEDVVLSFWPGYVFESGRQYYPGLENHFAYRLSDKLDEARKARYRIPSTTRILEAIRQRTVKVVVLSGWMHLFYPELAPEEIANYRALVNANYSPVRDVYGVTIYRRRE